MNRYDPGNINFAREEFPFYWLARVYAVYSFEMERVLKSIGLDVPIWRTLTILKEQGTSSISEIALHAVAKLPTMTKTIYRIQGEGLVETATSAQDARVTMVAITEAGRQALERGQLATQHIFVRGFDGLTPKQIERLNESLRTILDNLSPHANTAGRGHVPQKN